tara:strand:- start:909 stop:1295 length:387 start_codon:yes stop_codon:yes gene_type:complete
MESTLDLTIVLQSLAGLLIAVLVALATFGINWVRQKVGLDKLTQDDVIRRYLEDAIVAGVNYAISHIPQKVTVSGKAAFIAEASKYVLNSVPDALEHFGITEDKLSKMVEARLAAYLEPDDETGNTST